MSHQYVASTRSDRQARPPHAGATRQSSWPLWPATIVLDRKIPDPRIPRRTVEEVRALHPRPAVRRCCLPKVDTPSLYYEAIANKLRQQLAREIPEADGHGLRPAAGARRRPGRRLHDHDRGPRRPRAGRRSRRQTENLVELANQQPELDRATPRSSGPTSRRSSSTSNRTRLHAQGGRASGRLRHAADLSGLALRQRLQPLRPHLAGDRPGRGASTATRWTTSAGCGCATRAGRWCRWGRWPT